MIKQTIEAINPMYVTASKNNENGVVGLKTGDTSYKSKYNRE